MRKLKLSVEDLSVESFEVAGGGRALGTVRGNEYEEPGGGSLYQTCQGWHTCQGEETCNFAGECYTWEGGYTCLQAVGACNPTGSGTCTCPQLEA
jgi:hypothetical protein